MKILRAFISANVEFFGSILKFFFNPLSLYIYAVIATMFASLYYFVDWLDPAGPGNPKEDAQLIIGIVFIIAVEWVYALVLWKHLNKPDERTESSESRALRGNSKRPSRRMRTAIDKAKRQNTPSKTEEKYFHRS